MTLAVLILLTLVAGTSAPGESRPAAAQDAPGSDVLERILEKTEIYCRDLGKVSLHFVCRERIEERLFDPPRLISAVTISGSLRRVTSVSLEYDYQLVRKGDTIEEKRTLLKEGKEPRNEPDAGLKTRIYKHKYLVFGPGGFFSEYWRPKHAYTLVGEEEIEGEKAYLIEAAPSGPEEPGLIYGKAWIRKRDFAIVKIEWDQRSLGNYGKILATAKAIGRQAEPQVSVVGFYGVEKNGIRFPDRLVIREDYRSTRGIHRYSEATIRYEEYKFFVVETEVRY
ncbi:MAG: hypothetical protein JW775_04665 [Candidatus Aminicenantes bacterium]|nr:hypothetical protein [Candidatus Aminicenantes bacterium]